jgi:signal transduction histidine kinase
LSNALNALNGNGRVLVTTEYRNNQVEVAIRDNGRGMSGEELDHIFDPGFRVQGSRVSTGNWSLFSTRQIIYEHGGDISIDSAPGVGTTVRILLPA